MKNNQINRILTLLLFLTTTLPFATTTYAFYGHRGGGRGFVHIATFSHYHAPMGHLGYSYYRPRPIVAGHFFNPYYHYPFYPTIGFRIGFLPTGYYSFYVGPNLFFYYNDVYYRRLSANSYEVIAPPLGAKLPQLPIGAKEVAIDGKIYYEMHGTYYAETVNERNQVLYEVVGVNGVLGGKQAQPNNPQNPIQGALVTQLPANCHVVTLNGIRYYVSSNNVYYEEVMDGNNVLYKIVGN